MACVKLKKPVTEICERDGVPCTVCNEPRLASEVCGTFSRAPKLRVYVNHTWLILLGLMDQVSLKLSSCCLQSNSCCDQGTCELPEPGTIVLVPLVSK